jgi:hypothetical protein
MCMWRRNDFTNDMPCATVTNLMRVARAAAVWRVDRPPAWAQKTWPLDRQGHPCAAFLSQLILRLVAHAEPSYAHGRAFCEYLAACSPNLDHRACLRLQHPCYRLLPPLRRLGSLCLEEGCIRVMCGGRQRTVGMELLIKGVFAKRTQVAEWVKLDGGQEILGVREHFATGGLGELVAKRPQIGAQIGTGWGRNGSKGGFGSHSTVKRGCASDSARYTGGVRLRWRLPRVAAGGVAGRDWEYCAARRW